MGKRKGKPQANLGRPEDRDEFLAEAAAGAASGAREAAQFFAQAASEPSDDESEQPRRRSKRRRRYLSRQAEPTYRSAKYKHVVVDPPADEDQAWRFAELRVIGWSEAASASTSARPHQQHILEDDQLLLRFEQLSWEERRQAGRCPIDVVYQAPGSGGQWQGCLPAPDEVGANALLDLLKQGRVSCALSTQLPASGGGCTLRLSLTTAALEEASEDPEGGRTCPQLCELLYWLRPELHPELEPELGAPPLPGGSAAAASPRGGLAQQPGSAFAAAPGGGFDAAEIYSAVKPVGTEPELPAGATAGFLLPTLRRYQASGLLPLPLLPFASLSANPRLHHGHLAALPGQAGCGSFCPPHSPSPSPVAGPRCAVDGGPRARRSTPALHHGRDAGL